MMSTNCIVCYRTPPMGNRFGVGSGYFLRTRANPQNPYDFNMVIYEFRNSS